MLKYTLHILLILIGMLTACNDESNPDPVDNTIIQLTSARIGTKDLLSETSFEVTKPIVLTFSSVLDTGLASEKIRLVRDQENISFQYSFLDQLKTISIQPVEWLELNQTYTLKIDEWSGRDGGKFQGFEITFKTNRPQLEVVDVFIDGIIQPKNKRIMDVSLTPEITLYMSGRPDPALFREHTRLTMGGMNVSALTVSQINDSSLTIQVNEDLGGYQRNLLNISGDVSNDKDFQFDEYNLTFYTKLDSTLKFPEITEEELLTKVQEQTFKYFWDFGHPVSGLTRERNTSGETVTSGGSGFGLMAILVGIERGFITHQEGIDRLEKIITFLEEDADRFHGVWSHWLNGTTGTAIPFSSNDDGGDLVETAFMVQGLLTVRQYLNSMDPQESAIIETINRLWEEVEWDWYTQGGQDVLYWHWSPNFGWEKNHQITGWNEALIVYVLAAASPTHTIAPEVYTSGWSRNGAMVNSANNTFYGHTLDLRSDKGGPLFFAHYSFLGLDPRNLSDQYANYWDQNVSHSLINQAYCVDNPKNFVGYHPYSWGLTASDNHQGYNAHSPDNDLGVITPTAAISSIPYTPEESIEAIRHFYYILGDRLWGEYGFYDAFNFTESWVASSYLAIDQGPIVVMIENHRSGLLWDLFMSAPEVQNGLDKLGFTYE